MSVTGGSAGADDAPMHSIPTAYVHTDQLASAESQLGNMSQLLQQLLRFQSQIQTFVPT